MRNTATKALTILAVAGAALSLSACSTGSDGPTTATYTCRGIEYQAPCVTQVPGWGSLAGDVQILTLH